MNNNYTDMASGGTTGIAHFLSHLGSLGSLGLPFVVRDGEVVLSKRSLVVKCVVLTYVTLTALFVVQVNIYISFYRLNKRKSLKGNGSINDVDGTIGHGLTMHVAKGLSICERTCCACIAHPDPKASEQGEEKFTYIPVSLMPVKNVEFYKESGDVQGE